jgi:hypothetical protein
LSFRDNNLGLLSVVCGPIEGIPVKKAPNQAW